MASPPCSNVTWSLKCPWISDTCSTSCGAGTWHFMPNLSLQLKWNEEDIWVCFTRQLSTNLFWTQFGLSWWEHDASKHKSGLIWTRFDLSPVIKIFYILSAGCTSTIQVIRIAWGRLIFCVTSGALEKDCFVTNNNAVIGSAESIPCSGRAFEPTCSISATFALLNDLWSQTPILHVLPCQSAFVVVDNFKLSKRWMPLE